MTGLSNLTELEKTITDPKSRPYRKCLQIEALTDDIFSECAEINLCTFLPEFIDLFKRKETYLSMPMTCMGIADDAPVLLQRDFRDRFFLCSLFLAATNRSNLAHLFILRSLPFPFVL